LPTTLPSSYPHLLPEDAQLWNDYQENFPLTHVTLMYDVAVGEGRDPGETFEPHIRAMAIGLSKRRIDVVAIAPDHIDAFELTQSAGLKAVGQALLYPHWLTVTWQLTIPVTMTIICRSFQSDILPVLDAHHIGLVIIPPKEPA